VDGRCLVTLARLERPGALVLDGVNAYVASCSIDSGRGAVFRVPLVGGMLAPLATGSACASGLFADSERLYAAGLDGNAITRLALQRDGGEGRDGGDSTRLETTGGPPFGVTGDLRNVYFTAPAAGSGATAGPRRSVLTKVPLTGDAPTVLAEGDRPWSRPVVDATHAYFADDLGILRKVSLDGGQAVTVTQVDSVTTPVLSDEELYFGAGYTVMKVPTSGGAAVTLGTAAGAEVVAVAVDRTHVYFSSYGVVWRVPRSGGELVQLAGDQSGANAIAVDDTSVYWTNADASPGKASCCGSVMRLSPK
jgi:hypothetical protein